MSEQVETIEKNKSLELSDSEIETISYALRKLNDKAEGTDESMIKLEALINKIERKLHEDN